MPVYFEPLGWVDDNCQCLLCCAAREAVAAIGEAYRVWDWALIRERKAEARRAVKVALEFHRREQ